MGNYRIKLSDMIPNSWLYKLKDVGSSRAKSSKSKKTTPSTTTIDNLHESHYYYTLDSVPPVTPSFDLPRRSVRKKRRPKVCLSSSSASAAACTCRASFSSSSSTSARGPLVVHAEPPLHNARRRWSRSCCCGVSSSADSDIVLELEGSKEWDKLHSLPNLDGKVSFSGEFDELDDCFQSARIERELELDGFDSVEGDRVFNLELPPVLTRPPKFSDLLLELKQQQPPSRLSRGAETEVKPARPSHGFAAGATKEDKVAPRRSVSSRGVRVRSNSPRIVGKKMQAYNYRMKRMGESIAVVKSSSDPLKDFKESMMEMIAENNIRGSRDMEDLLACYLSLNSSEYHDVIVEVFAQIWLDLTHVLPY